MNKRLKILIKNLKYVFNSNLVNKIARKTKFVQRKRKFTAENFISLCVFLNEDLCTKSLTTLCSRLKVKEQISITPEALNQKFNKNSVRFIKQLFKELMLSQKKLLQENQEKLKGKFNRIAITDSSSFKAPKELNLYYRGNYGNGTESLVKIQLEYDLLTGEFINCEVVDGNNSDQSYLPELKDSIEENDLKLRDLGYFKTSHLKEIEDAHAFYLSRLKSNVNIYTKDNEKYTKIDLEELSDSLVEGETIEFSEVYLGLKEKLKSRLIVTKLSEENKQRKLEALKKNCSKKGRKLNERAEELTSINAFVTNVQKSVLSSEIIYEIYSLRWQVELMFKVWKSIFEIHVSKKVKIERFNCYLYGKLITLLLSTIIVFDFRDDIYFKHDKQLSEYKAFDILKEFLFDLRLALFMDELTLTNFFESFKDIILKVGIKCKKKGKKRALDILKNLLNFLNINDTCIDQTP